MKECETKISEQILLGGSVRQRRFVNNQIFLIEVGITNTETLTQVEIEKSRKYQILAEDLRFQHRVQKVTVVPIVMSWDAIVTRHFARHAKTLNLPSNIIAYMQTITLKRTSEIVIANAKAHESNH